MGDSAAAGHLLVDLAQHTLDRILPLALLPHDAPPLAPDPLPETLLASIPVVSVTTTIPEFAAPVPGPTFDASTLPEKQRERVHRNLQAVEQVLAGALQTKIAAILGAVLSLGSLKEEDYMRLVKQCLERYITTEEMWVFSTSSWMVSPLGKPTVLS